MIVMSTGVAAVVLKRGRSGIGLHVQRLVGGEEEDGRRYGSRPAVRFRAGQTRRGGGMGGRRRRRRRLGAHVAPGRQTGTSTVRFRAGQKG